MKVSYFEDSDTLYLELRGVQIAESRDFDENTVIDLDADGRICAITFEHASERTDLEHVQFDGLAA